MSVIINLPTYVGGYYNTKWLRLNLENQLHHPNKKHLKFTKFFLSVITTLNQNDNWFLIGSLENQ